MALGYDVAGEKQERKTEPLATIEAARTVVTVGKLADEYFERMVLGKWKHPNIVRSRIAGDIGPHLGKLSRESVESRHIDAMLQAVVQRGAPTMANDGLRWVRRRFDYAIKRQMVRFNPAAAFALSDAGGLEIAPDRALSRDELITLFDAMRTARGFRPAACIAAWPSAAARPLPGPCARPQRCKRTDRQTSLAAGSAQRRVDRRCGDGQGQARPAPLHDA